MKVHSVHVDGRQGTHGTNGQSRTHQRGAHGRAGEHGQDAGYPSAGCDGGSVELHLSSSTSVNGKIELVETTRNRSTGEESTQTLQLDIDTAIDVTAKGGFGGRHLTLVELLRSFTLHNQH